MRTIALQQPGKIVFGTGTQAVFAADYAGSGYKKALVIISKSVKSALRDTFAHFRKAGIAFEVIEYPYREPTVAGFSSILETARHYNAESIIGIGGGSVLDTAKLVAAMQRNVQPLNEVWGIGNLAERAVHLVCLPTTSGTGSEVSPNAILLEESTAEKKGIISPFLVPDAAYIDPGLTATLPPAVTAETGIDALSHCIEAYTNKFSHPVTDHYALKGIELIMKNLYKTFSDGGNLAARSAVALGSMYGGLCLGPVNTAAVHAISYPLGGKYHIPHGLANAVLLPGVMAFNMPADVDKHAQIALAAGLEKRSTALETAKAGVEQVRELAMACGIPTRLSALGIPEEAVDSLAELAMKVTRLLRNNPREVTYDDVRNIYKELF